MTKSISLINGEFKETISVYDRGLSYGDGLFETMLWHKKSGGKPIFFVEYWKRHVIRLRKGCKILKIPSPNLDVLKKFREKILKRAYNEGLKDGILKVLLTRGVGGRGYKFDSSMKPTMIFQVFPYKKPEKENYLNGVNVKFCKTQISTNENIYGIKHLNRLDSVLARSEWKNNYFEGVFSDHKGNLVEGTMTNIFFIKDNTLYTPKLNSAGIDGVMKKVVKDKAGLFFKKFISKKINIDDVKFYDGMFLTNSAIKILPVKKLGLVKFKITGEIKRMIDFYDYQNSRRVDNLELI